MKTLTFRTDDFTTVKKLAHEGKLAKLSLIFSLRHFMFMYKAKMIY